MTTEKIFVAIASYRDPECQHTVADLFAKATHPGRIFVGICWQFDPREDNDCFEVESPRPEQMRIKSYHWQSSEGGCWARAQALSLLEEEDYVLQLDAHMRFEQGWDEKLIETLKRCPTPRAALSTMLLGYWPPYRLQEVRPDEVPILYAQQLFDRQGLQPLSLGGYIRHKSRMRQPGPIPTPFVVANFLFGRAQMFREVPYDPYIYFRGQELTYALRLWTHGYDIYQPDSVILYHYWESNTRMAPRANNYKATHASAEAGRRRVWHILGLEEASDPQVLKEIERYGPGNARSVQDYWAFSGIDLKNRTIAPFAAKGYWDQPVDKV